MNPHAPAIVTPDGETWTLPDCDGHPARFALVPYLLAGTRWRYVLALNGQVARVEHAATPGLWTPHRVA